MRCLLALFAFLALSSVAVAEPRIALVIGNSNYGGELGQLPNPANDARLMAKTLKAIGFTVIEAENADQAQMKRVIQDFGAKLAESGGGATGLFFYAGHGLQVGGTNYLIPIHAKIEREPDVDIEAVPIDLVMKQMDYAEAAVNIVILDACRNNPLSRSFRAVTRGLADPAVRPMGSFIAYSTAPGDVAEDGSGANSPYTLALAQSITKPGASINDVFQEVRGKVLAATNKKQVPWDASSLTAPYYFVPAAAAAGPSPELTVELAYWDAIKDSKSAAEYRAYIAKYPDGQFVDLARSRLAAIEAASPEAPAAKSPAVQPTAQPAAIAAPAPEIVAITAKLYVREKARLRDAPSTAGKIIANLAPPTALDATGKTADDQWWRVRTSDGSKGFVAAGVVTDRAPAAPTPEPQPETAAITLPADPDLDPCLQEQGEVSDEERLIETCTRLITAGIADSAQRTNAYINLGHAQYHLDRYDEAKSNFQAAIDLSPDYYKGHFWMGRVRFAERDYSAARGLFDKAVQLDPSVALSIFYRGAAARRQGDFGGALPDIEQGLSLGTDNDFGFEELTYLHLHEGDLKAAVADADRAIQGNAEYYSAAALFAYYFAGRYDDALAVADRGMKAESDYAYWWIWKAIVQRASGDKAGATATLADARNSFDKDAWPMVLVRFLGDNISESEMRNLGRANTATGQAEYNAEIEFYAADQAVYEGDKAAAIEALQRVEETKIYYYYEYMAAPARLAALK